MIDKRNAKTSLFNRFKPSYGEHMPAVYFRGHQLQPKQVLILELIGEGCDNTQIAKAVGLSPRTIEHHIANIRSLIAQETGHRLGDRELVLFARDMLDGYIAFMRLSNAMQINKECPRLIEDWDEESELDDDKLAKRFDIDDFSTEERRVCCVNGKYHLL